MDRIDQPRADDLAPIYAELAALRAQVARDRRRKRFPRRALLVLLAALLVALVPLATLAANPVFVDLGQAAPVHQPNIQAIGNAGITTGYDDPATDDPAYRVYDPQGAVTREQMASFLARTAGLGGNPPVANAATAQVATNAAAPGGQPPSAYLPSSGDVIVRIAPSGFVVNAASSNARVDHFDDGAVLTATAAGQKYFMLGLDRPTGAFGRALVVESLAICYHAYAPNAITRTRVASAGLTTSVDLIDDPTPRTSTIDACHTLTSATANVVGQSLILVLYLQATAPGNGAIIRSVTLALTPTTSAAATEGGPSPPGPARAPSPASPRPNSSASTHAGPYEQQPIASRRRRASPADGRPVASPIGRSAAWPGVGRATPASGGRGIAPRAVS